MTAEFTIDPKPIRAHATGAAPSAVRDFRAAVRCAKILTAGAEDAAREWGRLTKRRYQNGMQGLTALMLCRSPADYVATQADMMSEHLGLVSQSSGRLSEIVGAAAGDAVRALTAEGAAE